MGQKFKNETKNFKVDCKFWHNVENMTHPNQKNLHIILHNAKSGKNSKMQFLLINFFFSNENKIFDTTTFVALLPLNLILIYSWGSFAVNLTMNAAAVDEYKVV